MLPIHLVAVLLRTRRRAFVPAVVALCAATLLLLLLGADAAQAADPAFPQYGDDGEGASDAGENIGDLIRGIAGPVALSVAGLFGIGAIVRRDLAGALTLMVVSVVILLFVIPQGNQALHTLARALADALGSA